MHHLGSGFSLEHPIGSGGVGEVWRGHDRLGRPRAIKILRPDLADDRGFVDHLARTRSLVVGLSSPHLVSVYDILVKGQTLAVVMELVEGRDLGVELGQRGSLPPAEALRYVAAVFRGLTVVHARGIVHGNVRAANVLLDDSGDRSRVRLTDFGLVATRGNSAGGLLAGAESVASTYVTAEPVSPQADVYAVGSMLYQLICGVPTFAGGDSTAALSQHIEAPAARPAGIDPAVWEFIQQLLAKDPNQRPKASAAATAAAELITQSLPKMAAVPARPAKIRPVAMAIDPGERAPDRTSRPTPLVIRPTRVEGSRSAPSPEPAPPASRAASLRHAASLTARVMNNMTAAVGSTRRRAVLAILAVTATIVMGASMAFALAQNEPIGAFTASVESSASLTEPADAPPTITVEPSSADVSSVDVAMRSELAAPQQASSTPVGSPPSPATQVGRVLPSAPTTTTSAASKQVVTTTPKKRQPTSSPPQHKAPIDTKPSGSTTAASDVGTASATSDPAVTASQPATTATTPDTSRPKILTTSLPAGVVGAPYSASLEAEPGAPVTWSIEGTLPAGLVLNGTTISGTPTAAGSSSLTVKGTTEYGGGTQAALAIVVAEPVVITTVNIPNAVEVTTKELPTGVVDGLYTADLKASGDGPFTWSIDGALPPGLAIERGSAIEGTPTTDGAYTFTASVTAANGQVASKQLTITIAAAPVQ